jgi:type IV pilus assembly protein PilW
MRHPHFHTARRYSSGLSLIEIMVGVAIALVTTLVIFQVFANSNTTNRSTAAGNEAQISGNIGMFQLERDVKAAGMGFGTLTTMSAAGVPCTVQAINPALAVAAFSFPLVPVVITAGAAGAPDQIDLLYGDSAFLTSGRRYGSATAISKTTVSSGGIQLGDLAVLTNAANPPTVCELVEITARNADGLTVEHRQGAGSGYTNYSTGAVVAAATRNSVGTPAGLNGTGMLYDLGAQPSLNRWSITNNNSLGFANQLGAGTMAPVAEGVAHLRAEYGVDDGAAGAGGAVAGDGIISAAEWTSAAPVNWSQVLAVRFAVLARSGQYEKTRVTTDVPFWANDPGLTVRTLNDGAGHKFTMFNVDGTADSSPDDANDWRHYRYRVYESVVAMRNMIWGTSP